MENIILPLEVKQMDQDDNKFSFEGHLAAFGNKDFDGDVIEKGAFKNWLEQSKAETIPVFWGHDYNTPVGVFPIKEMKEDDYGLFVKGILPKDDSFVSGRIIPQMSIGSVGKMSIGYRTKDFNYDGGTRILKDIDLFEGSLVALPANPNASITSYKSITTFGNLPLADRQRPWDSEAAIGRLRQWAGIGDDNDLSDPDTQRRYRQGFFWYDGFDPDLLGSYKLPFVDVIDDRLQAVPRGIFAAAAALRGARGGVMLPIDDRPGVIRNVERYYDKMGMESPFGKSFRLDDLSIVEERELERILKDGVRFSKTMSCAIISAIKGAGLREAVGITEREAYDDMLIKKMDSLLTEIKGA